MPAEPLHPDEPSRFEAYAVVAFYAEPLGNHFVRHVAILRESSTLKFGDRVQVWHMEPPVIAGEISLGKARDEDRRTCAAHAIGFVSLDSSEREGLKTWLAEVDCEGRPSTALDQYCAHPPVRWVADEESGAPRYRKFSCVGFVLECYREGAGIKLLEWQSGRLPAADLGVLVGNYDDRLRHQRLRTHVGLEGDGPWRIALPGYVLHSLSRDARTIRSADYIPASFDEASF